MYSYSSIRHFHWFISATRNTSNQSTKNTLSLWFNIFSHRHTCNMGLFYFWRKEKKGVFKQKRPEFYRRYDKNCVGNSLHAYSIFTFFFLWLDTSINVKDMDSYRSRNSRFFVINVHRSMEKVLLAPRG